MKTPDYKYPEVLRELGYPDCADFSLKLFEPVFEQIRADAPMLNLVEYDPRLDSVERLEARDKRWLRKLYDERDNLKGRLMAGGQTLSTVKAMRRELCGVNELIMILEDKRAVDTDEIPEALCA